MIIDSHVHIDVYPKNINNPADMLSNLKKIMKKSGIAKAVILETFADKNEKVVRIDELLSMLKCEPDFFVIGTVKITEYTKKDLMKLRDLLAKKKIIAIKIYPAYEPIYPSDKRCFPIYDICEEFNVPVVFHSGETYDNNALVKYSHPIHIDEVAIKRPNLRIVIAHCGNPWINDTILVIDRNKNVYTDISGLVWKSFDGYWKGYYQKELKKMVEWCGSANKLIFGTDWSCNDDSTYFTFCKDYVDFVRSLKISKADKEKILYKNAKAVYNLKI